MDIECLNCGEFWDIYYLCYDEVQEWGFFKLEVKEFLEIGCFLGSKDDLVFVVVQVCGWEFVFEFVLLFVKCFCCKWWLVLGDVIECCKVVEVFVFVFDGDDDVLVFELVW